MNEEEQKLKNLLLFKFYGTDKEFEEAAPFIGCAALILVLILVLIWIL